MASQFSRNLSPMHSSNSCFVDYFAQAHFWVLLGGLPDMFLPFTSQSHFDPSIYNLLTIWNLGSHFLCPFKQADLGEKENNWPGMK